MTANRSSSLLTSHRTPAFALVLTLAAAPWSLVACDDDDDSSAQRHDADDHIAGDDDATGDDTSSGDDTPGPSLDASSEEDAASDAASGTDASTDAGTFKCGGASGATCGRDQLCCQAADFFFCAANDGGAADPACHGPP